MLINSKGYKLSIDSILSILTELFLDNIERLHFLWAFWILQLKTKASLIYTTTLINFVEYDDYDLTEEEQ